MPTLRPGAARKRRAPVKTTRPTRARRRSVPGPGPGRDPDRLPPDLGVAAERPLRVLIASSEVHPFSKTGGLADMAAALARSLARAGVQVTLVTPLYRGLLERYPGMRPLDYQIDLPLGAKRVQAQVKRLAWMPGLDVYFIDQPAFYGRPELYQENGQGYIDNAARYIFFSKCVVHLARYLPVRPDVLHVHDWQTSLAPLMALHQQWREGWGTAPRTCLTIHNLAYQGVFARWDYELTNLPWDHWMPGVEFHGALNCLKAGIHFSGSITTVSPRYAREILTESFGCGLDGVLRRRQDALEGILNGVDYEEWRTEGNPLLKHAFSSQSPGGKALEKEELQREMGLPIRPAVPLFANISRLVDQKGSDLMLGALEEMLAADMQFVLLGSGSPALERGYRELAQRHPQKVAVRIGYDHALSHRMEAGSDFFLMPSRFEPCGLNQMYSLRYGSIPIVRATGGLDDSVIDAMDDPGRANGIKFREPSARALSNAIRKALALYGSREAFAMFRANAMRADFSWERTAQEYLRVYRRLMHPE